MTSTNAGWMLGMILDFRERWKKRRELHVPDVERSGISQEIVVWKFTIRGTPEVGATLDPLQKRKLKLLILI